MNEFNLSKMAWRNLWRNRRRTLVTLSSIAFGIFLSVLFTGLGDATYANMIDMAARMGGGHVTFQHADYLETPTLQKTVTQIDTKKALALETPHVERVVHRITGQAMLATAANNLGIAFLAVDPASEDTETLSVLEAIVEGEMLESRTERGILIGAKLAKNLDLALGKKTVYTLTDINGEIVTGLARVKGIIRTGAPSVDGALAILPIDTIRETLGYAQDEATQVAVFVGDQRKSAAVAAALAPQMDDNEAVRTWRETQPDLAGFISMKVGGAIFMEILIMVLIAAGIFNTLFVSVMERMREFGIMLAIGFSPGRLFRLVMWESFWLSITGLALGGAILAWPYHYLNKEGLDMSAMVQEGVEVAGVGMDPVMVVSIFPENAVIIGVIVVVATLVAGLYPAWRAGQVVPVESIKLV